MPFTMSAALKELESEAVYVLRETAARFQRPALLFSGGKDSIVLSYLAKRAFAPVNIPFPLLHVDTGHNFPETLAFRDAWAKSLPAQLIVRKVQDTIDAGLVQEETGPNASRNAHQAVTLMQAIKELDLDACIGGARRDEEKSRAKERFFSHRNVAGQWDPKRQRPEIWSLYDTRISKGENVRVFPLNNWTEFDIWKYILAQKLEVPNLYFSHERQVVERNGTILAHTEYLGAIQDETPRTMRIRFRTIGDATCTGATQSEAANVQEVVQELLTLVVSERASRYDDRRSDSAMEDRKSRGYF